MPKYWLIIGIRVLKFEQGVQRMKKVIALFLVFVALCTCAILKTTISYSKASVIIYTSMEQYAVELLQHRLAEEFPDREIKIVTKSTGDIATKVLEEGDKCEADVVFGLEYAYIDKLIANNRVYKLEDRYDMSVFEDDLVTDINKNYIVPTCRSGISIIVNNTVLQQKGLPKPTSYMDLIKPEYKKALSMPSPKSSGTGYAFYLAMVNLLGEKEGLKYFDSFAENIIQFTTSGSAPVNYLVSREAAVGIGMISQAAEKITSGSDELEIVLTKEGACFGSYASFIVNGKESPEAIDIMDFLYNTFTDECCGMYYPEAIIKGKNYTVANFPQNITYCDMSNNTIERKEELLRSWKH